MNILESFDFGTFYHVTEQEYVSDILENGFIGGWGDVGFGVYLYDNIYDAKDYAAQGGWDAGLENPAIIAIHANDVERVPVMSAEWDASLYENMWWHDMENEGEEARWKPVMRVIV